MATGYFTKFVILPSLRSHNLTVHRSLTGYCFTYKYYKISKFCYFNGFINFLGVLLVLLILVRLLVLVIWISHFMHTFPSLVLIIVSVGVNWWHSAQAVIDLYRFNSL